MVDYRGPQFLKAVCQRFDIDWFDRIIWMELIEFHPEQFNGLSEMSHLERVSWPYKTWQNSNADQVIQDNLNQKLFLIGNGNIGFSPAYSMLEFHGNLFGPDAPPENTNSLFKYRKIPFEDFQPTKDFNPIDIFSIN